ncbi:hypothetical protein HPP92_001490 [Vanilla planifolia]|uniref:RING-type domain-containing protein n=1 Tax=Vanilla planifolia TaxID=51239 RepID=A0A835RWC6_VANPL|nr:hypothetical protein HPP92_001490 [Vanilla planifolia]
MGFDNECICNIQSLPGEYFCPVCRTLIIPSEALQSQCTHLFCKPCLAYVVATTHACPYDGYLVTEADSKPLVESNKSLAETIGKVQVYCLYNRSGCQWQGTLSDCISHCTGCSFGNSPVVCNRCGTQIVHRQVQEHAQTCPGLQPQGHVENAQVQASTATAQDANKDSSASASAASAVAPMTNVTTSTMGTTSSMSVPSTASTTATSITAAFQPQNQGVAIAYPQTGMQGATAEQWYQQQQQQQVHYQQYYQQYPAYDPYQQQYQQYNQYQQQAYQQYPQSNMQAAPQQVIQSHQQAQLQMQQQTHVQPQQNVLAQPHAQPQQNVQAQPLVQPQQNVQGQLHIQPQQNVQGQLHIQPQQNVQAQPHIQSQQNVQTQPHIPVHPQPTTQPQTQVQFPAQGMLLQAQQPSVPQAQVQLQPQPHTQPQPIAHPQPHLQSHQLPHAPFAQAQNFQAQQAHHYVQPQINPQASLGTVHQGQPSHPQLQPYPQASHQQVQIQQNQLAVVPQQPLQPHMQHQQPQPQNPPRPLQQSQLPQQNQSQPQFQQTHMPPQPRPLPQPLPQSQTPAQNLPQPQHPSAQGVTGYQSYPQPQSLSQVSPGLSQQRPIPPQSSAPPHALQNQFPVHQSQQIRPTQSHVPVQAQSHPHIQGHNSATFQSTISQSQPNYLPHQQQIQQSTVTQPHSHALAQQQAQSNFSSAQISQQSALSLQISSHSQHLSRPPVQPYMLPQLSGPPAQGRPIVPNQTMSQQEQHSPANRIQSGVSQESPNHKYMSRQHVTNQEPQSSHSESLGSLSTRSGADVGQMSAVGSDMKSAVLIKQADKVSDNANQVQQSEGGKGQVDANASETSKSMELVSTIKIDSGSKVLADVETPIGDVKVKAKESKNGNIMEKEKRAATSFVEGIESSHFSGNVEGEKELQPTGVKKNEKIEGFNVDSSPNGPTATHPLPRNSKPLEMADQVHEARGHNFASPANTIQAGQSRAQGQLQQDGLSHERAFLQSVHHDSSPSQMPQQNSGLVGHRGIPSGGSFGGQQMCPPPNIPGAFPPNMVDSSMLPQRASGPDRMFPQSMHPGGSIPDRRTHPSFASEATMFDSQLASSQPRPPGYAENIPYKAQGPLGEESFQPPREKPPFGSTFPPQKREEINSFPVQNPMHGPPSHFVGPRAMQVEPFVRSSRDGPPSGVFDEPRGIMGRGSHFGSDGQASRSGHPNMFGAVGYYNGRQPDTFGPIPGEHVPYGQQNILPEDTKMNGLSGKGQASVMHDLAFSHSVAEDTFRPLNLPKKGFRAAHGEKFGPMSTDSGKHTSNPRMFEEGPGHFDSDGANRFNVYGPGGMPLEKGQQQFGAGMSRLLDRTSRSELGPVFPAYQSGGRFPPVSGSLELGPLEIEDRQKGPPFHENLGGKHDTAGHSERLRHFPEFSRPHIDNRPPIKITGVQDIQGHFGRDPDHLRREINAFDSPRGHFNSVDRVGHGLLINNQGREPYGARNLPDHPRFGDSLRHGPFRGAEPIGFDGYGWRPFGDSKFPDSYVTHPVSHDVDSFENLNKRKHGSMGWCRLCMIDCETVEGLELHSQTKDHQNKAMEIVLSIKKENAKQKKLTSEEVEDANIPRRNIFEKLGGRR